MFHRILVEEWQRVLSIISILIFLLCFLTIAIRTWRMPRQQVRRLESLPLSDDQTSHEHTH